MLNKETVPRLPSKSLNSIFIVGAFVTVLLVPSPLFGVTSPAHKHKRAKTSTSHFKEPVGSSLMQQSVPVFWQTTRSRFLSSGPSTQTESYRETWKFEPRDDTTAWLTSSRGRALVYGKGLLGGGPKSLAALVIGEHDLARLVGIPLAPSDQEDLQVEANPYRLVALAGLKGGDVLVLKTSDDEHFSVQFEMGQSSSY